MGKRKITQEVVRDLLDYNPESGVFTWRKRAREAFGAEHYFRAFNTRSAGKRAGHVWKNSRNGYQNRVISLFGHPFLEHRIAWLWMVGEPIPSEIDHANRDATDNRWCNIRASSHSKNMRNQSMSRANTSGVTGVTWNRSVGKWQEQCLFGGKNHYLGCFSEIDEAAMVVMEFRAENGFDVNHGMTAAHYHAGGEA